MPELPVETVRRGLEKLFLGKTIQSVEVKYPRWIQTDLDTFIHLPGQRSSGHGAPWEIPFILSGSGPHLAFGWKIFPLSRPRVPLHKHAHVFFHFTDGSTPGL